jgi:hypothetical protein
MSHLSNMITKGDSGIAIQRIYNYFGGKPFTYQKVMKKIPKFKRALITSMRETSVIKLVNGKKRAVGITTKNPSVWVFTTEALFVLRKMYDDKNK